MKKELAAVQLKQSADEIGLLPVLNEFCPDVRVRLPMTRTLWDTPVDDLQLSVRSGNGVKRAGAMTVGDVAGLIMSEGGLQKVRNLGRKSISEIKTELLCQTYEHLTDGEKTIFWLDVITENGWTDRAGDN